MERNSEASSSNAVLVGNDSGTSPVSSPLLLRPHTGPPGLLLELASGPQQVPGAARLAGRRARWYVNPELVRCPRVIEVGAHV